MQQRYDERDLFGSVKDEILGGWPSLEIFLDQGFGYLGDSGGD